MKLILASASPWRRELLSRLELPFACVNADVDESPQPGESPRALALRLAALKADTVLARHPDALVIGSDQVGTLDGHTPVGKPGTLERAVAQLQAASGRSMHFHTALSLRAAGQPAIDDCVDVQVRFRTLTAAEIRAYLARDPDALH